MNKQAIDEWKTTARAVLIVDEGFKNSAYQDTKGYWTIGVGHLIGKHVSQLRLSNHIVLSLLDEDIEIAWRDVLQIFGAEKVNRWTVGRQMALLSISFNLGGTKLRDFQRTIAAINNERWDEAARNLENSLWAKQVGFRANRLIAMVRTGHLHSAYATKV